jgi:hypothetical protein
MAKRAMQAVFDEDAQRTVGNAIHAFYRIRRLAFRALDDSDAESFCMAITEISQLHGKALDDCATRVTGRPGVGCFDKGVSHG